MAMVVVVNPNKKQKKDKAFETATFDDKPNPLAERAEVRRRYPQTEDELAGDLMCYRNEKAQPLVEAFPFERDLQYISKFYPYAKGGPLYIDCPMTKLEEQRSLKKVSPMLKAGKRFYYVNPGESSGDVLKRFDELDNVS
jgi:hypothetical protein